MMNNMGIIRTKHRYENHRSCDFTPYLYLDNYKNRVSMDFCQVHRSIFMLLLVLLTFTSAKAQKQLEHTLDSIYALQENAIDDVNILSSAKTTLDAIKTQCTSSPNRSVQYKFYYNYASVLYFLEKYEECLPYLKKWTSFFEQDGLGDLEPDEGMSAYASLGDCYLKLGMIDDAENAFRKGLVQYDDYIDTCPSASGMYKGLLNIYESKGDTAFVPLIHDAYQKSWIAYAANTQKDSIYTNGLERYKEAIEGIKLNTGLDDAKGLYTCWLAKANVLKQMGMFDEAVYEYDALACKAKASPHGERIVPQLYLNRLLIYKFKKDSCKIKQVQSECADFVLNHRQAKTVLDYSIFMNQLGMFYDGAGDIISAEPCYSEAITTCQEDSLRNIFKNNYAGLLNRKCVQFLVKGDLTLAQSTSEQAMLNANSNELIATIKHNQGRICMLSNHYHKALKLLEESAKMQKETFGQIMERTQQYINECREKL